MLDAINSLDIKQLESRETRSLEELLDPHDWRLVEVLKFRQRIKDAERNNEQHTINSIKRSFEKYKLTDRVQQAIVLRYLGLNFGEIQAVTDLGRNKIYHHVIHKFPDLGPKDVDLKIVENRLRTQGLEKILREFQANVS